MLKRVPRIQRVDALSRIGFYGWVDLTLCTLKGLRAAISFDEPLPDFAPTRSLLVGRFHHRIMELAEISSSVEEIDAHIDLEIEKLQRIVSTSPHLRRLGTVSGWDEVNMSATTAIRILRSAATRAPVTRTHTERELYSNDRLLVGRPDYFAIHSDVAELKDYKTGALRTSEGEPIQQHLDQLRFYAALLFDNFSLSRISGTIVGINGDRFELSITFDDAFTVANSARQAVAQANGLLDRDIFTLAAPSSRACHNCNLQVVCPAFRRAQTTLSLDGHQMLLDGAVVAKRPSSHGASVEITLLDKARSANVVVDVPADRAADIEVSRSVCVSNLRSHGRGFLWSFDSQVYAHD